ncbi:sensor histidine kinase [Microbacterium sp. RD1]|uniref:sensor histidine kinase n=1 Tax=Microbacterium sp. RD1 TaxID=3457313 RepID=UPI003FA5DF8F
MSSAPSRSSSSLSEEELRLPRAPGMIRQFWARHPLFADILIATVVLLISLISAGPFTSGPDTSDPDVTLEWSTLVPFATVVAGCVLLVWRRRWPVTVFAVAVVSSATFLLVAPGIGSPLLLVASYSLAVYRSARSTWIGLGAAMAVLLLVAVPVTVNGLAPMGTMLSAIIGEAVLALIGALIGINVGNRRRYLTAIIDRSRQLLVERDQQAQLAAATERARIAREMHDIVSHSLTVIVALSEGAAATPDRERARAAMDATATTARGALTEMRAMLGVLRDSTTAAPLTPIEPVSPETTVATAQHAGFPASLTVTGTPVVSDAVRYAIGRIVQEGMTNAMRHAPRAASIAVRIEYADARVTVTVRNDGVSGVPALGGFGIRGVQERVTHVGGTMISAPEGDGWWMLRAVLPTGAGPSEPGGEQR